MHKLITAVFVFCIIALPCVAQTESLLIGPGDLIDVEVFDTPEMSQEARVTDAGNVRIELIGDLKLAGETPGEAAQIIEAALIEKQIMRKPQVRIRVEEYATQDVSVLGQVRNPGTYSITAPQSVLKILSLAGGLTDVADRNVTIERHGDTSERIQYYLANDSEKALSDSVIVNPGDIVIVPRAPIVYVLGDVARPGAYTISTNDSQLSVLQAIAMAGSANKTSMRSQVRLIRKTAQGPHEIPVKLVAIQKGKQPDVVLQPDDVLYVPFSWMKDVALSAGSIVSSTSGAAVYGTR